MHHAFRDEIQNSRILVCQCIVSTIPYSNKVRFLITFYFPGKVGMFFPRQIQNVMAHFFFPPGLHTIISAFICIKTPSCSSFFLVGLHDLVPALELLLVHVNDFAKRAEREEDQFPERDEGFKERGRNEPNCTDLDIPVNVLLRCLTSIRLLFEKCKLYHSDNWSQMLFFFKLSANTTKRIFFTFR